MWQTYQRPASLEQALALLAEYGSQARIVAGATDLIIELDRGVRRATTLIDITPLPGLDAIRLDDQGLIHLGPLTTHSQVTASQLIRQRAFPLARAAWEVGAPQIRARGTVAGNLITASPANDTITPLWALDAAVTLASVQGRRTLPFAQFFQGVRRTAMQDDEMLVDIQFPAMPATERGMYIKLGLRRAQAVSVINVVAILDFDGPTVRSARIALGAVAPTIVRASAAEAHLVGSTLSEHDVAAAAELAQQAARPIDDVRSQAAYRRQMVSTLVARALRTLRAGEERAGYPENPVLLGTLHAPPPIPMTHNDEGDDPIETRINGRPYTLRGANGKTLLRALRENASLIGTKEGCAEGECGACTVYLDGQAVMSCLVPAPRAHDARIVTIEGLASDGQLHPVQQAFVEYGAVQCGYCTPGLVMAAAKLLEENPHPDRAQVQEALTGNLCRCTGYAKVLDAVLAARRGNL